MTKFAGNIKKMKCIKGSQTKTSKEYEENN